MVPATGGDAAAAASTEGEDEAAGGSRYKIASVASPFCGMLFNQLQLSPATADSLADQMANDVCRQIGFRSGDSQILASYGGSSEPLALVNTSSLCISTSGSSNAGSTPGSTAGGPAGTCGPGGDSGAAGHNVSFLLVGDEVQRQALDGSDQDQKDCAGHVKDPCEWCCDCNSTVL